MCRLKRRVFLLTHGDRREGGVVDAETVIANVNAEVFVGIDDLDLDRAGCGMTKRVEQRLTSDAIDVALELTNLAFDDRAECDRTASREILARARERLRQLARRTTSLDARLFGRRQVIFPPRDDAEDE